MSADEKERPPRRLYPYVFFGLAGALAGLSIVFHVLAVTQLNTRGLQALAVSCVCLAGIVVAATLLYRKVEASNLGIAVLAYDVGRSLAHAKQAEAYMGHMAALLVHLVAASDDRRTAADREWLADLRKDLDAVGEPDVADIEPLLHLRRLAERLHDSAR